MPSDRDLAQQLTAELDAWMVRCGGHIQLNNDLLAQHLVAWLSTAGHLVPEGSEVREEWGTRVAFPDGVTFDHWAGTRERAEGGVSPRECTRTLLRRSVITTPWTPTESAQRSGVAAQEKP